MGRSAQPEKCTRPSKTAAMYEPRYRHVSPRAMTRVTMVQKKPI